MKAVKGRKGVNDMNKNHADYVFFEEKVFPLYHKIVNFITYVSQNQEVASDIAQDTMESAWKYREKIRSYQNLEAGLITIAKNNLKKYYLKNPACVPIEELENLEATGEVVEEIVMTIETGEELNKMIYTLDNKYKSIIILHDYYDLSIKEIAKMYGANCNTVYSWHARAMKKLRDKCMKSTKI